MIWTGSEFLALLIRLPRSSVPRPFYLGRALRMHSWGLLMSNESPAVIMGTLQALHNPQMQCRSVCHALCTVMQAAQTQDECCSSFLAECAAGMLAATYGAIDHTTLCLTYQACHSQKSFVSPGGPAPLLGTSAVEASSLELMAQMLLLDKLILLSGTFRQCMLKGWQCPAHSVYWMCHLLFHHRVRRGGMLCGIMRQWKTKFLQC